LKLGPTNWGRKKRRRFKKVQSNGRYETGGGEKSLEKQVVGGWVGKWSQCKKGCPPKGNKTREEAS